MPIPAATFRALARFAREAWDAALILVDPDGRPLRGRAPGPAVDADVYAAVVREALRFGEAVARFCGKRLVWGAPLLVNARLTGGLAVSLPERVAVGDPDDAPPPSARGGKPPFDLRAADAELRRRLEAENLTNAALLAARRETHARERSRAEAIHAFKGGAVVNFLALYLQQEPALLAAVRRGDRAAARGLLNELLVAIHHRAGERVELTKAFFMELVTTLCRHAVELGAEPEHMLGTNFDALSALAGMDSMEDLGPWLHAMLERLMAAIHRHRETPSELIPRAAMDFMRAHYRENISRDDAARAAHVSPAHFSRVFRRAVGQSFTEALNRLRVEHAAERLAATDDGLAAVAARCGFRDASYFTKVFRRYRGLTPKSYRRQRRARV